MNEIILKDREIYLYLKSDDLVEKLSINEWNAFIESYEKDEKALVTPYDENLDGRCFITTTLKNIVDNHNLFDLRFMCRYRSEHHLSFGNND